MAFITQTQGDSITSRNEQLATAGRTRLVNAVQYSNRVELMRSSPAIKQTLTTGSGWDKKRNFRSTRITENTEREKKTFQTLGFKATVCCSPRGYFLKGRGGGVPDGDWEWLETWQRTGYNLGKSRKWIEICFFFSFFLLTELWSKKDRSLCAQSSYLQTKSLKCRNWSSGQWTVGEMCLGVLAGDLF